MRRIPRVDVAGWLLRYWPELLVLGAVVIVFAPVLGETRHFPYDAEYYYFPLLRTVQQDLSAGHLPAWDPYTYGGIPLLANAQSAWIYPPNLILDGILTVTGGSLTEQLLYLMMIAHFAAAAVLTVRLARRRGLTEIAAAFAGVFVICCGLVIARTQHAGMIEALPWIPLGLILIDDLAERTRATRVVGLAIVTALIFTAGFLPVAPSALFLFGAWAALRPEGIIPALRGCAAGVLLGLLLAAILLLPILGQSGVYPVLTVHNGLPTSAVLTAILPTIYGHWSSSLHLYDGPGDITNSYYYSGGAAIVLTVVAVVSSRAARRELVLIVVLLLLSFGAPATWVVQHIQVGAITRLWRPEDFVFVASVPLAVLVARGLTRAPTTKAITAALLLIVILAVIPFQGPAGAAHFLINSPPQTDVACLGTLALLAVAWRWPLTRSRWVLGGAALLASVELISAVPSRFFIEAPGPTTAASPSTTGDNSTVLTYLHAEVSPSQRILAHLEGMPAPWGGFADVWRISDANGFQPQFSRFQLTRIDAFEPGFSGRVFPLTPAMRPYMEEMNAPYAVVSVAVDTLRRARGFKLVFSSGLYRVYRARGHFRRAFPVRTGCRPPATQQGLTACIAPGIVSTAVSGQSTRTFTLHGPISEVGTGEVWYPGWHASAGGTSLTVTRLGYMAAVRVPKGVTRFTMSYSPPGLGLGAAISGVTLLVCGCACAPAVRRRLPL